jgi:hypothetical protein
LPRARAAVRIVQSGWWHVTVRLEGFRFAEYVKQSSSFEPPMNFTPRISLARWGYDRVKGLSQEDFAYEATLLALAAVSPPSIHHRSRAELEAADRSRRRLNESLPF